MKATMLPCLILLQKPRNPLGCEEKGEFLSECIDVVCVRPKEREGEKVRKIVANLMKLMVYILQHNLATLTSMMKI